MNLSTELRRTLIKKETFFTARDEHYFADPRWKEAEILARQAKYLECQKLVANIDRNYCKSY